MGTASQHGNEVKSTPFGLFSEAAMKERAPMASIIAAGTTLTTVLVVVNIQMMNIQMFCQLVQFPIHPNDSFKTVDASFVFNGFHQPAECRGGFAAGRRPSSGPKALTGRVVYNIGRRDVRGHRLWSRAL